MHRQPVWELVSEIPDRRQAAKFARLRGRNPPYARRTSPIPARVSGRPRS